MDPLSIIAGSIAVLGAGGKAVKGLTKLKDLRKVPDLLLAVVNEVSDLSLIVQEIRSIFGQNTIHGTIPATATSTLIQLLDRAQAVLLELDQIVNYRLLLPPKNDDEINVSHSAWLSEENHVLRLQGRLRTIRLDIAAGLAALNLSSTVRLELRLQELSLITEDMRQSKQLCETRVTQGTQQNAMEQLLTQLRHLQELQHRTDNSIHNLGNDLITSRELTAYPRMYGNSSQRTLTPLTSSCQVRGPLESNRVIISRPSNAISIKMKQFRGISCPRGCLCRCHTTKQIRTPQLLDRLIGTLFLGYSRTPVFAPRCNEATCGQHSFGFVAVTYLFPHWFLHQILSILLVYTKRDGPELSLRMLRTRSDSDSIFYYAGVGDVASIQSLFAKGEASPFDITASSNNTILSRAIIGMHPELCQFLLNEGADPYFQIGIKLSGADLAWDKILRGVGDTTALAAFRRMFADDDYLENQLFTTLHKIVLGLDCRDLRHYLQTCSRTEIDRTDKKGQTALYWAAARADSGAVQNLLAMHADPNILNCSSIGPLHRAAENGKTEIIKCLLNSGAQVDIRSIYQYTPLMLICYSATPNPDCIRILIDSGANIDAQDSSGATALIFASQFNFSSAVTILLENHADVNKSGFNGETALHVAVQTNSHDTLDLLLSHHANSATYTELGRSILHEAAEYGDLKTIQILRSAGLQGLEITRKNLAGDTPEHIANRRTDEPPEWHPAFSDLLASVTEEIPDASRPLAHEDRRAAPASVAVRFILAMMTQLYEEMQQIHRYAVQLPRPPNAVLRALLVACVAVVWRLLP